MGFGRIGGLANAKFQYDDTVAKFTNLTAQLIDELVELKNRLGEIDAVQG
jgi:hypothetical protein